MIKKFNDVPCRDGGSIYRSYFEKVKMIYEQDPMKGGELAVSIMELILTGQMSTDDVMLKMSLTEVACQSEKRANDFDKKMEAVKEKKKQEQKLDLIAQLSCQGLTQKQIGDRIGTSQQTVGNRLNLIKNEYPELLEKYKRTSYTNLVQEKEDIGFVF